MIKKQKYFYFLFYFLVISVAISLLLINARYFSFFYDNYNGKKAWNEYSASLSSGKIRVNEIKISGDYGTTVLNGSEVKYFIKMFAKSKFNKSNNEKNGPTPSCALTIYEKGNKKQLVTLWGMSTFEMNLRQSQILIDNDKLGKWINSKLKK